MPGIHLTQQHWEVMSGVLPETNIVVTMDKHDILCSGLCLIINYNDCGPEPNNNIKQ